MSMMTIAAWHRNRGFVASMLFLGTLLVGCNDSDSDGAATDPPPPSTNADLSTLSLSVGMLDQAFQTGDLNYTSSQPYTVSSIQVIATAADAGATIRVDGDVVASGDASQAVALPEGQTTDITVLVTAADTTTSKTYTIAVTRESAPAFAQRAYIKASNTDPEDRFGYSVALSGNTLAVGAAEPFDPSIGESSSATGVDADQDDNSAPGAGAVYVFVHDGTTWSQQAYIKASNTASGDRFGVSVALSGNTLAVGAPGETSAATGIGGDQSDNDSPDAGAVYVFTRTGTDWSQQAYLKPSNTLAFYGGSRFGMSVALSGDTLAAGALGDRSAATGVNGNDSDTSAPGSGAVFVFVRNGTDWSQQAYIKASNPGISDQFGWDSALDGNTLVVGAPTEDSAATGIDGDGNDNSAEFSGAAYVFVRNGTDWSQQAYIKASNASANSRFGLKVAVSGDTLAVGVTDRAAVYVFVRNGGTWSEQALIPASAGANGFGASVAVQGDKLAVGANGAFNNTTGVSSGTVYLYQRSGTDWVEQAQLNAAIAGQGDGFGTSVALSDSWIAIGATG
ncbi:MAG: cadherin-like beta sandwich domain-containing protein, partial [Halieaceae bacterium]|nr:cadherin-like beta sandwich domain-containing protein [Halieaceae bacterium]